MLLALWLMQEAPPDSGDGNINTIRIVAAVLALAAVVVIFVRRKKKASKEDWT
jgi:LPXTG-motif cell wall-anchored protein